MGELLQANDIKTMLGERKKSSNKGDHGKGLLLAGSEGFSGAAVMAAAASLRAGIGTLKVVLPKSVLPAFYALPEAMANGLDGAWSTPDTAALEAFLSGATAIAIGPGMGSEAGVAETVLRALQTKKAIVIDADGLNALARTEGFSAHLHENAVLTPHPGEMARITGMSVEEIIKAPREVAAQYAVLWGCTVLLKGAVSFIAAPSGSVRRNETGNAGLAKGGSGDVLTGLVLAFLGQGLTPFGAACAGAYILGASADEALALLHERALMARDVTEAVLRTLERF